MLQYFDEIGHQWVKNDDTAWCAAFLNWVLKTAKKGNTGSLLARSFLKYGVSTKIPELGDIVVLWRIAPTSLYGHCGLYIREINGYVYVLGGNQANAVNISAFPRSQVLDFRKVPLI